MKKNYTMLNPHQFQRAVEHEDTLVLDDTETTESIQQWFEENGFLLPVFYVVRMIDGNEVNAVLDGWKKILYARQKEIELVPAVQIQAEGDELISVMLQLQSSGHNSLMTLYRMCKALYPIHYRGQGYRGDLTQNELEKPLEGKDGRKLNIYERIGRDLGIKSGNKIKYILMVGEENPLHFERIENSRFTLYQAYSECKKAKNGYQPDVPKIKEPIYHSNATDVPEFTTPNGTDTSTNWSSTSSEEMDLGDENGETSTESATSKHSCEGSQAESVAPVLDEKGEEKIITVRGLCQCCRQETDIKININNYL